MQLDYPITVLSDLHVGHPASYITDPEDLAPLFRDAATVVFNGDSVEMLWVGNRDHAQGQIDRIVRVCLDQGARPLFLSGNHDPVVSSASHLDLADGAVLVTHGDILFHEIAPWSREAGVLGPAHARILEGLDEQARSDLEERLLAVKRTALCLEMHEPPIRRGPWARLATAVREGWPPWRVLWIVRSWVQTPRLADELATRFRPRARFVLVGHTHYAGVWSRADRVVVNTGSFLPLSGRYGVRLEAGRLEVRKIGRAKGGWAFGRTVATHELQPLPAGAG